MEHRNDDQPVAPTEPRPRDLDAELARLAARLGPADGVPGPSPGFAARLWEEMMDHTAHRPSSPIRPDLGPIAARDRGVPRAAFPPATPTPALAARRARGAGVTVSAAVAALLIVATGLLAYRLVAPTARGGAAPPTGVSGSLPALTASTSCPAPSPSSAPIRGQASVALVLVVDQSGSMSYDPLGGTSKIAMAREALRLALGALSDGDQIGILAFNDQHRWVVPLAVIAGDADRRAAETAIAGIEADGGTEALPALAAAANSVHCADARVRHVVLISDGKSRTGGPDDYARVVADLTRDGTTLSAIAVGDDADIALLRFLADKGAGRYHFVPRPVDLPQAVLDETRRTADPMATPGSGAAGTAASIVPGAGAGSESP